MPRTTPAALGLVVGSLLLSGCSMLSLDPRPEQSVAQACAVLDSHKLRAQAKPLGKAMRAAKTPQQMGKALDSITALLETAIEEVKNPQVKVQAQLTSIALRNLAAEGRTYKPTRKKVNALKDDVATVELELSRLNDLCGWS